MGWATPIGAAVEQVEYRLEQSAGCGLDGPGHTAGDPDRQLGYRLDGTLPLTWIGSGLKEFGQGGAGTVVVRSVDDDGVLAVAEHAVTLAPGEVLDGPGHKAAAMAIMDGRDPFTGEVLVKPKMVIDPRGKLPAADLVAAIAARAAADPKAKGNVTKLLGDDWAGKRFGRAERGLAREGEAHRIAYNDAVRLAGTARVDLAKVFGAARVEQAKEFHNHHLRVGHRGFDVTFDLPGTVSTLWGIADPELANRIAELHTGCVTEAFASLEGWGSYHMAGHHGDGKTAKIVQTSGFSGWLMPHAVARPVDGQDPDPHLHIHGVIAHLAKGEDGKWRTIGGGGQDVYRHAHAVDAIAKARFRAVTSEELGMQWEYNPENGAWEVVGIPAELSQRLSKRSEQVAKELERLGLAETASRGEAKTASAQTREPKTAALAEPAAAEPHSVDLRASWRNQAVALGLDPARIVAAAVPDWPEPPAAAQQPGGPGGGPRPPAPTRILEDIAGIVFHAETGITAHRKDFRRAQLLAAVADAMPAAASAQQVEDLATALVKDGRWTHRLPELGFGHLTNHDRYTTLDILEAERTVTASAARRYGTDCAIVPIMTVGSALSVFEAARGFELNAEQRETVARLLLLGHGVDAVVGVAGSGKTTLLEAARTAWEANGMVVAGSSTAAVAAANLQAESGIRSYTVAAWLRRISDPDGPGLRGVDVLVVDEAAMVDDRQMARLVAAAEDNGTKLVMLGDPQQLRSPGVGGSFAAVHEIVKGLQLRDNRRQADEAEKAALAVWRTGDHAAALRRWARAGRIHAVDDTPQALAEMLTSWNTLRQDYDDPHAAVRGLLLLAGTNADVDRLNHGARAIRIANGEIDRGRTFATGYGGRLQLSVGDVVMTRVNDYRFERSGGENPDVLNGWRGIVTDVRRDGISVRFAAGADPVDLTAKYIARGGVSHGYALTVAKSQGLTASDVLVYGAGLDPNTLYPALSRQKNRADLWLPLDVLEDEDTRIRLGDPASQAEQLDRAVAAYAEALKNSGRDIMVSVELGEALPNPRTPEPEPEPQPVRYVPAWPMAWERAHGMLTDEQLASRQRDAERAIRAARLKAGTARAEVVAVDADAGPAISALRRRVEELSGQAAAIRAAGDAARETRAARTAQIRALPGLQAAQAQAVAEREKYRDKRFGAGKFRTAQAEVEQISDTIAGLDRAVREAAAKERPLAVAAPDPKQWEAISAEYDRHRRDIDVLAANARAQDATYAAAQRAVATKADAAAQASGKQAEALAAEADLRQEMPGAARSIEDGIRRFPTALVEVTIAARTALGELDRLPENYRSWQDRPVGTLSDRGLDERAAKLAGEAATARRHADDFRAQAAAARDLAARDGGPELAKLARTEQQRHRAAELDLRADPIRERQTQAEEALTKAIERELAAEQRLAKHTKHNLMRTVATFTTADALRDRLAEARAERVTARAELKAISGELDALGAGPAEAGRDALKAFQRRLPTLRERAHAADIAAADRTARGLEDRADAQIGQAERADRGLAAVDAEKNLRRHLPEPVKAMENTSRAEHQRVQIEQGIARRERARHSASHGYSHEHDYTRQPGIDRDRDRGPSLGR